MHPNFCKPNKISIHYPLKTVIHVLILPEINILKKIIQNSSANFLSIKYVKYLWHFKKSFFNNNLFIRQASNGRYSDFSILRYSRIRIALTFANA